MSSEDDEELETRSYVWEITDFASLQMLSDAGNLLESPLLNVQSINNVWKFYIYPKGQSNEDYIGFLLFNMHFASTALFNCTLSIGRPNQTPVKCHKYQNVRFINNGIGEELFLRKKLNSWILREPVIFQCDITEIDSENYDALRFISSSSNIQFNFSDYEHLSLDLENFLKHPVGSDLTVSMNGHELYIHKYMLHARCPNMRFGYRSIMEAPSYIESDYDDEIFELLIHYIYTGKIKDSYVPLELFQFAKELGLTSLIKCLHEQAYSYHAYSKVDVENKSINWDLDELNFFEKGSMTFVHILRTELLRKKLAIQVTVSDADENEKILDISFKIFNVWDYRPILLTCKISLTSKSGLEVYKEDYYVFRKFEQWNFPRISCKEYEFNCTQKMCLTAELSICEGQNARSVKNVKTKTKLYTDFQTITDNLESLSASMILLSHLARNTGNCVLLSSDNRFFHVHDGIMWARWPGLRKLLDEFSCSSDEETVVDATPIELNLPSEVLEILLLYLYSGLVRNLNRENVIVLFRNNCLEYPFHFLTRCRRILFH